MAVGGLNNADWFTAEKYLFGVRAILPECDLIIITNCENSEFLKIRVYI